MLQAMSGWPRSESNEAGTVLKPCFDSSAPWVTEFSSMSDFPLLNERLSAIRIRAHTLLCLQGFRGEGYSPGFVENMAVIHRTLAEHPETVVEVRTTPDVMCGACPHHRAIGCTLKGEGSEQEMNDQDGVVLRKLGLEAEARVTWREILERIRHSVSGDDLPSICGTCRWLPLGYCREGIERLRKEGC